MDNPFNIFIIIVIVVVFIGRVIIQATKKPEKPPEIPVHFEDDEPEYPTVRTPVRSAAASPLSQAAKLSQNRPLAQTARLPSIKTAGAAAQKASPAGQNTPAGPVSPQQNSFALNLNRLSPMQQAVIMAEILGTPKGLSDKL